MHPSRQFNFSSLLPFAFSVLQSYSVLGNDDTSFACPVGYELRTADDQHWCYTVYDPDLSQGPGLSFDDAVAVCKSKGDSLPILTTEMANLNLGYFRVMNADRSDDVWIGIVCDGTGLYMWQDEEHLDFKAFKDPPDDSCSDKHRFAQSLDGQWLSYNPESKLGYCVCARRAEQLSQTTTCPDKMFEASPSTGWCYGVLSFADDTGTYFATEAMCSSVYEATLPSISSQEESDALTYILSNTVPVDKPFWIGLKCGSDGKWFWANGEAWSGFTNFQSDDEGAESCDPVTDSGHMFNTDHEWEKANGHTVQLVVCTKKAVSNDPPFPWIILVTVGMILCFAAVIAVIVIVRRRFVRLKNEIVEVQIDRNSKVFENHRIISNSYSNLPNRVDEWEIDRIFVSIDYARILGEGAFGSVYLGRVLAKNIPIGKGRSIAELYELTNNNDTVAIKMLHESALSSTERDFRNEIDLMKAIGFHERLVNILACVTQSAPVLLITEYCSNGDLLEFMRQKRNYILEHPNALDDANSINSKKQIMFAVQIAYGLEYLSSRGFVHRDIAARNIMIDQRETCKIGDFGLCREIGKDNENYLSQGGKLPLKWMPPEAIEQYQFSTASDVWSFGVLLFEIVTLGGNPYAGWPASELLERLKLGERMNRPDNCSEKLYEVMSNCWSALPSDRPTFAELRKRLGVLLEDESQDNYYLKLNAHANYYVLEKDID